MTTDTSEKGLESLICAALTGSDGTSLTDTMVQVRSAGDGVSAFDCRPRLATASAAAGDRGYRGASRRRSSSPSQRW